MRQRRSLGARAAWIAGVLVVLALAGAIAVIASSAIASRPAGTDTRQDVAATNAYLLATYAYEKATLATLPESVASLRLLAGRLGHECPDVLSEAKRHPGAATGGGQLESEQLEALEEELDDVDAPAELQPNSSAVETFYKAVLALHWSNPEVALAARFYAAKAQEELTKTPPALCSDADAWGASGYRTLAPATKALRNSFEASGRPGKVAEKPLNALLAPYEGAPERAISARLRALAPRLRNGNRVLFDAMSKVAVAVGLKPFEVESLTGPPKGTTKVGAGKTAAGGAFTVTVRVRHDA